MHAQHERPPKQHIVAVHTALHIQKVENQGLYEIATLAAGGAIQAAQIGLSEPCFRLIRPPGHHASAASSWGFCYFNNMAVSLEALRRRNKIESACVLDIDLHFGDGTVNILGQRNWVTVINVEGHSRSHYLQEVEKAIKLPGRFDRYFRGLRQPRRRLGRSAQHRGSRRDRLPGPVVCRSQ